VSVIVSQVTLIGRAPARVIPASPSPGGANETIMLGHDDRSADRACCQLTLNLKLVDTARQFASFRQLSPSLWV
jgi:hypothetical protein